MLDKLWIQFKVIDSKRLLHMEKVAIFVLVKLAAVGESDHHTVFQLQFVS